MFRGLTSPRGVNPIKAVSLKCLQGCFSHCKFPEGSWLAHWGEFSIRHITTAAVIFLLPGQVDENLLWSLASLWDKQIWGQTTVGSDSSTATQASSLTSPGFGSLLGKMEMVLFASRGGCEAQMCMHTDST